MYLLETFDLLIKVMTPFRGKVYSFFLISSSPRISFLRCLYTSGVQIVVRCFFLIATPPAACQGTHDKPYMLSGLAKQLPGPGRVWIGYRFLNLPAAITLLPIIPIAARSHLFIFLIVNITYEMIYQEVNT